MDFLTFCSVGLSVLYDDIKPDGKLQQKPCSVFLVVVEAYCYISCLATAGGTFRLLHVTVARLFAEQLQKDLAALKEGRSTDVSLAAKWAPTPARKTPAPQALCYMYMYMSCVE